MAALTGTGVLVTRPLAQSRTLCALLEREGARTWLLPVLEIRDLPVAPPAARFDLLVFSSANAVRAGAPLLAACSGARLAAIGPATARALAQAGHPVSIQPAARFDSESLLAHPDLQRLEGHRVLLVKGRGGRALLEQALRERGAEVQHAEVYERVAVQPAPDTLATLERHAVAGEIHVVTVTSAEIGAQLLAAMTPGLRIALESVVWIVPSVRVGESLTTLGLRAPLRIARSAEDQDLLGALFEARGPSIA